MEKRNISILGCGWLGLPLLTSLVAEGHTVKGSSRNAETLAAIEAAGGQAFNIDLPGEIPEDFTDGPFSTLIITLPPRGRALGAEATEQYLACLKAIPLLQSRSAPCVLFTSSTGVYGDEEALITEDSPLAPTTPSGHAVVAAENWLSSAAATHTVLRLAGLVAADRHPGRFYGGRDRPIPQADAPVNVVHRADVIAAIHLLLEHGWQKGEVYNVCAAAHPTKGDFYTAAAQSLGLPVAGREPGGADGKIINSDKLRALGWQPRWDDLDLESLKLS
jgi:nucleoside-diphosphate-sugar epimerase